MIHKPARYISKIVNKKLLNKKTMLIELEMIKPSEIHFHPGQFVNLKVSDKNFRSYSICSSNSIKNKIQLIISCGHDGIGANYVKSINVGDNVELIGPSGRFILHEDKMRDIVFIVTGTGIAPVISMLEALSEKKWTSKTTLLFGVRDFEGLFMMDKIQTFETALADFEYQICFSQSLPDGIPHGVSGRVTNYIPVSKEDTDYYICGNPNMVHDVITMLTNAGVSSSNIHHEKFTLATRPKNL